MTSFEPEKSDSMPQKRLLDRRFRIEILDSRQPGIGYHREVEKDLRNVHQIPKILKDSFDLFHSLILPVFLKRGKKYSLIARYWVLYYIIDRRIRYFPAIVFTDPHLKDEVLALEQLENSFLFNSNSHSKARVNIPLPKAKPDKETKRCSTPTQGRVKARKSGRLCPFCHGPLAASIGDHKKLNENPGDGPHRVTCGYKKNAPNYCSFAASLTEAEIKLFKDRDRRYETEKWVVLVPEKYCPECKDAVYRRTIQKDDGSVEIHERCRKLHQTRERTCDWDKKLKGQQ